MQHDRHACLGGVLQQRLNQVASKPLALIPGQDLNLHQMPVLGQAHYFQHSYPLWAERDDSDRIEIRQYARAR